jgi:predicted SAM-dependent methyltransferase
MNYNKLEKYFPRGGIFFQVVNDMHFKVIGFLSWVKNGHFFTKKRIKKYYLNHKTILVHLGADDKSLKGFLNTGVPGKIHVDITKRLPFPDNSVDLVFSSHVVEHIYREEFKRFLKETYMILKKGGINIIITPSIEKCSKILYVTKGREAEELKAGLQKYTNEKVTSAFYLQGLSHMFYHHKFIYDLEEITWLAKQAGYKSAAAITKGKFFGFDISKYLNARDKSFQLQTEVFVIKK